ncbi:MAG: S8 family peptidase [Butyrivibrio sp.]
MRKIMPFISTIVVFVILVPMLTSAQSVLKEENNFNFMMAESGEGSSVITDELKKYLLMVSDDELIPVTIELIDCIDNQQVDKLAMKRANVSEQQLVEIETLSLLKNEGEGKEYCQTLVEFYDRISLERNKILSEYYQSMNVIFLKKAGLMNADFHSIGIFVPFIRKIYLTKEQILFISEMEEVRNIYYETENKCMDFATLDAAYNIIRGNISVNDGYRGQGIRVGDVQGGHPDLTVMGNDGNNIIKTNAGTVTSHATQVCAVIKKMAPDCTIYTSSADQLSDIINSCEELITQYNVNVINITRGQPQNGEYNSYSRQIDRLVKNNKVTFVIAAGNGEQATQYINALGMSPNAITVGGVTSYGTDPTISKPYELRGNSLYREKITCINKPDISAPGSLTIYGTSVGGTSYSAPFITGTVVQMMCRNVGLKDKPETIKAALIASAYYNAGTPMTYVSGTKISNQEGAGVVDAGFCYRVARNGRRTHFDATPNDTSFSYNVYCDYTTKPFRVACAWEVISVENSATYCTDYDMKIYKNGTLVATSTANSNATYSANTNYEVIEIPTSVLNTYGAGYYEVRINRVGNYQGSGNVRIGLAWEQVN